MGKTATAGNRGARIRSDCFVTLQLTNSGGIDLQLKSKVEGLFGRQIKKQVEDVLEALEVKHASVEIEDSGALPFVIGARLEAAVKMLKTTNLTWTPDLIEQSRYETDKEQFRFSRLYLPGNSPSMMINAGIHQPNGVILDLEDSVAPIKKSEARLLVRNALCQVDFYGAERMVRINQLPEGLDDLDEVIPHQVHLILIPKCENGSQVKQVEERIDGILKGVNQERQIFLMPIVESCLGVENAFEIATASQQVVALAIGLEDYTADLGVRRTEGGEESLYARTRLSMPAKRQEYKPLIRSILMWAIWTD